MESMCSLFTPPPPFPSIQKEKIKKEGKINFWETFLAVHFFVE